MELMSSSQRLSVSPLCGRCHEGPGPHPSVRPCLQLCPHGPISVCVAAGSPPAPLLQQAFSEAVHRVAPQPGNAGELSSPGAGFHLQKNGVRG